MNRRSFFKTSAATAALSTGLTGCSGERDSRTGSGAASAAENSRLAGKTLVDLRDEHRYWLFEDFLPFMDAHVVDHEYGGFMCNTDRDGTNITTNKRGWYEGRGIWVYSFLYNNFGKDPKHLEIARKSVELIAKNDPGRGNLWPENYTREGKPFGEPDARGYGSLFIANGFQEYAKASGEERYFTRAKEILSDFIEHYDKSDYAPDAARGALGQDAPLVPGARVLGVWMVLIRLTTQMLAKADDPAVKAVNDRCIGAITQYHLNPEFDLLNEVLNHDMSRPAPLVDQLVTGHSMETLWMLMYEAARRSDKELFFTAAEWFKRHVEVMWDDVYGGVFHTLKNVNENVWTLNKVLWAQEEVLIGTLCMVEHMGEEWARDWYDKMYTYVLDKYPLAQYGYPIWNLAADRKVTFTEHYTRVGNFHHPRHLMLNLLALERIMERNGKVSVLFG